MAQLDPPRQEENGPERGRKPPTSQATLSAIGDVSVAATAAVSGSAAPRRPRWFGTIVFFLVAYIGAIFAAIYARPSPPWVQVFVVPLLLVVVATFGFWRWRVWKFRARQGQLREQIAQTKLNSLAHVVANGANAIRAHLMGIERGLPENSEHLAEIALATGRIQGAVATAVGEPAARPSPASSPPRPNAA